MARPKERPTEPTPELLDEIMGRYAQGEPIRKMLQNNKRLPHWITFLGWLTKADKQGAEGDGVVYQDVATRYARAKVAKAESGFQEIEEIEVAMRRPRKIRNPDLAEDEKPSSDNPRWVENPEHVDAQTGRVLIDSIKWRLSKMRPELYGDRTAVDMTANVKHSTPRDEAPEWLQNMLSLDEAASKAAKGGKGQDDAKPASSGSTRRH